ncbi:transposase [Clostridium sp. MF28]|uniref:RNA-guided endonuclease TnpB family protein n=1 Tax=Clostridium TaxID=1485 RepID=UPI000CF8BE4A|nr:MULTISPECIES: RNA-guided endonuclease TnpB family protein [Clostridium]AVK49397.1 transposase [Clostridium sp. MF28]PSM57985.1 transposase [Clostridium diolis]
MITARKIKLTIAENREEGYSFIRKELQEQNKALNMAINHLYFNYVAREKIKLADETYKVKLEEGECYLERKYIELKEAKTDKQKENIKKSIEATKKKLETLRKVENKEVSNNFKEIIATSEQINLRDLISNNFNLKSDTKDKLTQKVVQDFYNDIVGVLRGERTLRRYKKDNPLYIRGRSLTLYREGEDYYIKWMNGIVFKCVLGVKKQNSLELQKTLDKVIFEEYKLCDSSIGFKDNKLILNLTLDIPVSNTNKFEKVIGRIVGVDLGMKIPAYCALNDSEDVRKAIGSIDDFLKVRTQMRSRRRKLQRALKSTNGGQGKNKKLSALNSFEAKEKNFAKTYNHFLSSNIIKFATDNKAEQINMEFLSLSETQNKSVLSNWSYYQLQQMIEYKAERIGIKVKYVDPYLTSQTCSECGHYEDGQREVQSEFQCKKCGCKTNADYNASRNIAKSDKYITKKEESEYYKNKI